MINELNGKSFGYLLNYTSRMAMALLQKRIKEYNVAAGQFPVLVHLWEEQGLTQRSLCDLIRVEQPTLANTLKRMERDGLIERKPDENDRRQTRIFLTAKALELRDVLRQESDNVNGIIVKGLSETEQEEFRKFLLRISLNLENELAEPR